MERHYMARTNGGNFIKQPRWEKRSRRKSHYLEMSRWSLQSSADNYRNIFFVMYSNSTALTHPNLETYVNEKLA